jgi:hypothetical protein
MPDVSALAYPDQPLRDFEPASSHVMHEGNERCAELEQSNALRVSSESLLAPLFCC